MSLSLSLVVGVPPGELVRAAQARRARVRDRERPGVFARDGTTARLCRPCCRSVGGMSMSLSLYLSHSG